MATSTISPTVAQPAPFEARPLRLETLPTRATLAPAARLTPQEVRQHQALYNTMLGHTDNLLSGQPGSPFSYPTSQLDRLIPETRAHHSDAAHAPEHEAGGAAAHEAHGPGDKVQHKATEWTSLRVGEKLEKFLEHAEEKLGKSLKELLHGIDDPAVAGKVLEALEKVPAEEQLKLVRALTPKTAQALAPEALARLGKLAGGLDEPAAKALGALLPKLDEAGGKSLLKFAESMGSKELSELLVSSEKLLAEHPEALENVGKFLAKTESVLEKLGLATTAKIGAKVLGTALKALPVVGAGLAFADAGKLARDAADSALPPEIRYLAGLGAMTNGTSGTLDLIEVLGVTNVALPANLALAVTNLALDLTVDHLKEQHAKGEFKPSKELDSAIAGSAMALGPAGLTLMMGMFGPVETARKFIHLGEVGSKFLIDSGMFVARASADAVGQELKLTAKGIDMVADMVRHPEKYAEMARHFGAEAVELGRKGLAMLGEVASQGGELAAHALKALGGAVEDLKERAKQGVQESMEALKWAAQNPGELAKAAKNGLVEVAAAGGKLAKEAWNGLKDLGEKGLDAAQDLTRKLIEKGGDAVELLDYIAHNPGKASQQVVRMAREGLQTLVDKGGELGKAAIQKLIGWANQAGDLGKDAVEALTGILQKARDADLGQIVQAWQTNLTDGGKEVLRSLGNLGEAGFEALGKLAVAGGQLMGEARNQLKGLVGRLAQTPEAIKKLLQNTSTMTQRVLCEVMPEMAGRFFELMGVDKLAALIVDPGTPVDFLKQFGAGALSVSAQTAEMLGKLGEVGLQKLKDAFGEGTLKACVRGMQNAGIAVAQGVVSFYNAAAEVAAQVAPVAAKVAVFGIAAPLVPDSWCPWNW